MKRFLVLLGAFIFSSVPAFAGSFPDVPEDHLNYKAIEYLDSKDIISGYEDGTFKPDNFVNRAEAVRIIVGAFKVKHDDTYEVLFPDVKETDWFFKYIMGAKKVELISGYEDGTFKPGDKVNLAETLKIIVLASKVTLVPSVDTDVFSDVLKTDWYAPHSLYARDHNIVMPDEEGKLNAGKFMTRAEFAEVIYRMMTVLESNEKPFPLDFSWAMYKGTLLPFKMKYDDKNWELIENEGEVIFFRPDKQFSQFSPFKVYPNSAVVTVSIDKNDAKLDKTSYFSNIKAAFPGANYTEFELSGLKAIEVLYQKDRTVDWYIYLGNSEVLAVYTEFGNGLMGYQNKQIIKTMLSTFSYEEVSETKEDYSQLLSEIFENILVEGKGMEMLDTLPDKLIIETDAIGVGTGPVDYYYSSGVDYTFKYERASDVILDKREGQTSAF